MSGPIQAIRNSRENLLLRTDILQKQSFGAPVYFTVIGARVRYAEDCVMERFILWKLHFILEERFGRSFHDSDLGPLLFLIYSFDQ